MDYIEEKSIMVKEIVVESIGKYLDEVFTIGKEKDIKNDNFMHLNYTFRGQNNEEYSLSSSLRRNYGLNARIAEKRLLKNFKKYGVAFNSDIGSSIWKNIVMAQHHGLPTRFLDFSYSPLVALHFALIDNKNNKNAVVWAINVEIVHNKLIPEKYVKKLKEHNAYSFDIEMLEELEISIESYNDDMKENGFIFIEPMSIDARIVNQWSNFAIVPDAIDPLDIFLKNSKFEMLGYKFIIPSSKIPTFRKQLNHIGINERILFPDIDGLASYLKKRYAEIE
jgi:hypothetical protein